MQEQRNTRWIIPIDTANPSRRIGSSKRNGCIPKNSFTILSESLHDSFGAEMYSKPKLKRLDGAIAERIPYGWIRGGVSVPSGETVEETINMLYHKPDGLEVAVNTLRLRGFPLIFAGKNRSTESSRFADCSPFGFPSCVCRALLRPSLGGMDRCCRHIPCSRGRPACGAGSMRRQAKLTASRILPQGPPGACT